MGNYANVKANNQLGKVGGYKPQLYFAPIGDITTWGRPTNAPAATGDTKKITTAHVFAALAGAIVFDAKMHSVTHKSTPVGDEGAQDLEHSLEVKVLGDDAGLFEQVDRLQNDQVVVWAKDADCLNNDSYVQIGDDCMPVICKVEFDGKTTKDGKKEYTLTFTSKKKFFYLAALTILP